RVAPTQPGKDSHCPACKKAIQLAAPPLAKPVVRTQASAPAAPSGSSRAADDLLTPTAIRPSAHLARGASSAGAYLLVAVVAATMTLGITLAIVYWPGKEKPTPPGLLLAKNQADERGAYDAGPSDKAGNNKKGVESGPSPSAKKPVPRPPEPEPEPDPPLEPLPAEIDAAAADKAKRASVAVNVVRADGSAAAGSGFFALEPGLVFTTARLLGLKEKAPPPRSVQAVLPSGQKLVGSVVAFDLGRDVAAFRVPVQDKDLPTHLTLGHSARLAAGQKLYVVASAERELVSTKAASLRPSTGDELQEFEVAEPVAAAATGAPVLDTRGEVVGMIAPQQPGAPTQRAAPANFLSDLVDGRVVARTLGEPYRDGAHTKVRLDFVCADPLSRIKELKVVVWTGDLSAPKSASWKPPRPRPGDGPRTEIAVDYQGGRGSVDILLPELPKDKVYWLQPVLVNGSGRARWLAVEPWEPLAPPLERRPARFAHRTEPATRKTQLTTRGVVTVLDDKAKPHLFDMTWRADLAETIEPGNGAAKLRLKFERLGVDFLHDGLPQFAPAAFLPADQAAGKLDAAWHLAADGTLSQRSGTLEAVAAADRKLVKEFYDRLVAARELLAVPLPQGELKPLETWTSKRRWSNYHLDLEGTYEGRRLHDQREEAYVSFRGMLTGIGVRSLGHVEGHGWLDLAKGHWFKIELNLEADIWVPFVSPTEVKALGRLEARLSTMNPD
ncbi:MAG: serine protease, partial [Gemmataceae bacterium]|nr:serine protease [Gemmataceae bacterium]